MTQDIDREGGALAEPPASPAISLPAHADDRPARADARAARARPRAARKAALRRGRLISVALLASPALWLLVLDVLRRARHMTTFDRPHAAGYAATVAASLGFWGLLLYVASGRRGAARGAVGALFVALFTLACGVQGGFHALYNIYCSIDSQIHSQSIPWSIVGTLPLGHPSVIAHFAVALGFALGALRLSRRLVRPRRLRRRLAAAVVPLALAGVAMIPVSYRVIQSSSADMIYFHGITALVKEHLGITNDSPDLRVQRRHPERVPRLSARPARPRNVVLILQESQRADVTCVAYDPACDKATPFSNAAAPRRMPLLQMRAHDSTTAISISNIWSGVPPTESLAVLGSAPLLWDYAHAAGWDTAYWTSQNLMFGNARLYVQDIPVSHRAVATQLDPGADLDYGAYDRQLTDRVIEEWDELVEPFFAVVHYSNVHFPYVSDPLHSPFQPSELTKAPEKNEHFKNYYKNVVYLSDMAVGRLIEHIRGAPSGERTVIVYTSDHGESFREHWQLGHTSSLWDEEILVPTWVDAPEGTLAPEERASIEGAKDTFVWHLDLAPTFLDLMGLWDEPGLDPFRRRMIGHPLTRPERTVAPMPLTNCTWVWGCAFRNWGMMQGPMKIEAREWDGEYHCFNVLDDPLELTNLGEQACAPLPDLARGLFHEMPNVTPPGRPKVDWGG
ncbi:sulfatase-like hydrolase/transferase [Sorangium atrum]|uniref:Sulfatase-like hydrolase/transferase n=1 Tax=Sorangium atrum TaxID=2995308 RepID=A0ABT5C9H0_9BACT|nr:sulfatase-like hydrolase/transferase [Sorangium aterium]MDC0682409.1 sulfatase-like hydrolase/transferase [Sorangium aterium]